MTNHVFDSTLLREYDVRGVVGKTLFAADAMALGRAYATYVGRMFNTPFPHICLGYDGRLSSPELEEAALSGMKQAGAKVTRVGLGPTPMLYFSVKKLNADAGMMITGSHNPPDYNGFKMLLKDRPVYGAMIKEIGALAVKGDLASGTGSEETKDVRDLFVARLLQDYDGLPPLKIVWDNGNGAAGDILQRLTAQLPGEHTILLVKLTAPFPIIIPIRRWKKISMICAAWWQRKKPISASVLMVMVTALARLMNKGALLPAISFSPFMPLIFLKPTPAPPSSVM
jgi:phosphomannomutase